MLRRGRPPEVRDFRFVARHAALRARRGVALADFLEAFRCYHNVVWEAMTDAALHAGAPAHEALAVAGSVVRYVDLAATASSAAFLDAQQLLVADSDRIRRDLLEDLLAGARPRVGRRPCRGPRRRARRDGGSLVVAALPTTAPEDDGALRGGRPTRSRRPSRPGAERVRSR